MRPLGLEVELRAWLGIRDSFPQWMRRRIAEYGFEEGADYSSNLTKTGGRPRHDFLLTIDTAKELAMVERTERGCVTRCCFIEMGRPA